MAFPNVPIAPGVPSLNRDPNASGAALVLLAADAALSIVRSLQPRWGVYLNGQPILASSLPQLLGLGAFGSAVSSISSIFGGSTLMNQFSIVSFDYKQDWTVAEYPTEQGGFQSYDKVQHPFDVRMRVAAGGSESNRQALLNTADDVANSMELYDVITPEQIYSNCNCTHYDYRRASDRGVGLIIVDMWFTEIRVTSTATFTSTKSVASAGQQSSGNVQAQSLPSGFSPTALGSIQ